ncbi:predicted protein [Lichtheimia corymbifera JMRC:FSU:9682]|uniref:Uncharacterized protein n=1 Tax=Lichtheimia corymbifera JMRC:FSU:9682 TaxID=1263082 RepID=A0A068SDN7_9FUNG|nr:predicted protein [Lichtheimia corymbifera JMRC:FSU:9682]
MNHPTYQTGDRVCYRLPEKPNFQRIGIIIAAFTNPAQRVPKSLLRGYGEKQMMKATEQAPVYCIEDTYNGAYALVHMSLVIHGFPNHAQ